MNTLWGISLGLILTVALTLALKCDPADQFECIGYEAECDGPDCVCNSNFTGNPFLACHYFGYEFCNIFSDPRGKTFGREPVGGIDIPLPCKYLVTDIHSENGSYACDFQIFAAEERGRGKFFVSSFEMLLNWENFGNNTSGDFSFRVHVERIGGVLDHYVLRTRDSTSGPYGPYDDISALDNGLGGVNLFYFDNDTLSIFVYLDRCGFDLVFRAADDLNAGKNQPYLPGLSVAVDEANYYVDYKLLNETFCLTIDKDDITVGDVANMLDLKEDHAFIYRALVNGYPHDMPNIANTQCEALEQTAKSCTDKPDRMKAFEECDFIWKTEHFVNCYSDYDDSRDLVTLFNNCIQAYCHQDVALCLANQADVSTSGCGSRAPPEFTGFDCTML